jgi:pSer/pThr/pTyr-binding forkhead associated (FHA) protein
MPSGLIIAKGPKVGSTFELRDEVVVIGRDQKSVDFAIPDPAISRRHARLTLRSGGYEIEDLKSSNGTFVNSKRISGPVLLAEGDVIDLGKAVRLSYQSLETGEETVIMPDQEATPQIDASRAGYIEAAVTPDHVSKAYAALASGDAEQIKQYWAEEMVWQVPGQNRLSGWYYGRGEFLAFMGKVGELSGGSFRMDAVAGQVLVTGEYSCDLTRNRGHRAGEPDKTMDIEVAHVLRWRDGKVIAGKGAIFGDGTTEYDQFWSESRFVTPPSHGRKES